MKKIFVLCVTCFLLLTFSGCGSDSLKEDVQEPSESTDSEENITSDKIVIEFGNYEQDNNESNGLEPIEWFVLENDGEKALLVSKYILDWQEFNDTVQAESATWEYSTLRTWLNSDLLKTAFSDEEQNLIISSGISDSIVSGESNGKETKDKVFLLSYNQAWTYFESDSERMSSITEFASDRGAYVNDKNGNSPWWLITPAPETNLYKMVVNPYGKHENSPRVNENERIRPAIYIMSSALE